MLMVTGGAGFIGSNFILEWLRAGDEGVVNFDLLTYAGNPRNLEGLRGNPGYRLVQGDVADAAAVATVLREARPRAIVHFAAESHVDRSILGPEAFLHTNVVGTFRLLDAARAYWLELPADERAAFRFLHVSTDEVYGSLGPDDPPFTEASPYAPNSPYAASKAASDHFARAWHHTYGFPVLTTNCSNNYGPLQYPEKLIPLMIHNACAGLPLPIYGTGANVRDWLHVTDHCSALRLVLARGVPGEVYNIGGDSERSNTQVVHALCDLLDALVPDSPHRPHRSLIRHVADRPGHDWRYAIDAGRIRRELGWSPAETFESGLARTVRWYLDHADWVQGVKDERLTDWMAKNYAQREGVR